MKKIRRPFFAVIATVATMMFLIGCQNRIDCPDCPEGAAGGASEFETVLNAIDNSLANMVGAYSSTDLKNDVDAGTPQILSVRSAEDYAKGHIPGALNVPWKTVYDLTNAVLTGFNKNDPLTVYCYTGHSGAVATLCLNIMGYNSQNLKWGIMSWTDDATVRVSGPFTEAACIDAATNTTIENYAADNSLPYLNNSSSCDDADIVQAAVEAYLTGDPVNLATTAQALKANLDDGDDSNNPFILSVRSAEHYALGHIPGAANIPWRDLASDADALKILPTDRQIVVYCYTGHTGGLAATALNLLGYDAVNLKWGIMSWTDDDDIRASSPYTEAACGIYTIESPG